LVVPVGIEPTTTRL